MSSQKQTTHEENPTAMIFESLKRESYRNKNQCNIQKNAAKTIHRMLNTKIMKQSLLGLHQNTVFRSFQNCSSPDHAKRESLNLIETEQPSSLLIVNKEDEFVLPRD